MWRANGCAASSTATTPVRSSPEPAVACDGGIFGMSRRRMQVAQASKELYEE